MRGGWITVLLASACGRLSFDTVGDGADARSCTAPAGHDEDGDGVDDACDVCPHVSDDQRDGDGDGVGDTCDPEPSNARQQFVLFDPMIDQRNTWELGKASIDATGGHLMGVGAFAYVRRPTTDSTDVLALGGSVLAAGSGGYHIQITVEDADGTRYFYCELYGSAAGHNLALSYTTDGSNFLNEAFQATTQDTVGASGTIAVSLSATECTCNTTWDGETVSVTGSRHGIGANRFLLAANNLLANVDWFVQIRTN